MRKKKHKNHDFIPNLWTKKMPNLRFCSWSWWCCGLTKTNTNLDISNFFQGKSIVKNVLHPGNLTCPLKNDGWKMSFLLGLPLFRGYVKFPGCTPCHLVCVLFRTCFTQVTSALTFFHTARHLSSSCKRNGLAWRTAFSGSVASKNHQQKNGSIDPVTSESVFSFHRSIDTFFLPASAGASAGVSAFAYHKKCSTTNNW